MATRSTGDERVLALLVGGLCAALGVVLGVLVGYAAAGLAIGALGAVVVALLPRPPAGRGRRRE